MRIKPMRNIIFISVLTGVAIALAACSGAGSTNDGQRLTVEAQDLAFSPTALEVTAGDPVNLTLQNNGALEHDFSIMEFPMEGEAEETGGMDHDMGEGSEEPELHIAAGAGQSAMLDFTPSKPGTYEFWCTVPGHKEAGMTGTLVVNTP
jgi:uncharacterized cupredoxin-like copper-binding protein